MSKKKEVLIVTTRELKEILKDAEGINDNTQFTIEIEKPSKLIYYHISEGD